MRLMLAKCIEGSTASENHRSRRTGWIRGVEFSRQHEPKQAGRPVHAYAWHMQESAVRNAGAFGHRVLDTEAKLCVPGI